MIAVTASRPLRLGRLRAAAPLAWAGLALWAWATAVLPAVHLVQHAREAVAGAPTHRQRIQTIVDEVLGRAPTAPAHHGHSHGAPGQGPHGKGSIEHLDALFAAVPVFAPPDGFQALEPGPLLPAPPSPTISALRLSRHPRGPPPLLSA